MHYVLPVVFVVLLWWASTVLVLYRSGRSASTFVSTLFWTTFVALAGAVLVWISRDHSTVIGAYAGFTGAMAIWALHETSYLLGYVTGPRPQACPDNASTLERFRFGVKASLYHELAIVATVALLAAATWQSQNRIALLTFVVLWLMRWSVKINIFLGVRNLHHEFWPSHLQYLKSYTRTRAMNAFFPWSVVAALIMAWLIYYQAADVSAGAAEITSAMLVLSILSLALLEHLLLMLPVSDTFLWRIGLRSRESVG